MGQKCYKMTDTTDIKDIKEIKKTKDFSFNYKELIDILKAEFVENDKT